VGRQLRTFEVGDWFLPQTNPDDPVMVENDLMVGCNPNIRLNASRA
jgi:DNA-directed RNA polymerase subunit H (RpoH/RPB5)